MKRTPTQGDPSPDRDDIQALESSVPAKLAYERCDGTPADYFAKLVQVHDLFDELALGCDTWLAGIGLDLESFIGLIAGVRDAEAHYNGESEATYVHSTEARKAVGQLFVRGIEPDLIATILGLEPVDVANYLEHRGFSEKRQLVLSEYREGRSVSSIADRLGCSRNLVYDTLRQAGIQIGNGRTYSDSEKRRVVEGYRRGASPTEIAEQVGFRKATVVNILRAAAKAGQLPEYPRGRK